MNIDHRRARVGIVIVMAVASVYAWFLLASQVRYQYFDYQQTVVDDSLATHVRAVPAFVVPIIPTAGTYLTIMVVFGLAYWALRPATCRVDNEQSSSSP